MKLALKVSLATNAGLVVLVLGLAYRARFETRAGNGAVLGLVAAADQSGSTAPAPAFRWSQLESPDYRVYIANLEAIGCPRQTIRDIVIADVDGIYAPRRKQLMEQVPDRPVQARADALAAAQVKLKALDAEEAGVLAELLGLSRPAAGDPAVAAKTPPTAQAQGKKTPSNTASINGTSFTFQGQAAPAPFFTRDEIRTRMALSAPVTMPLAFQDPPANLGLNQLQQQAVNDLRNSFSQEISSLKLNPSDPEYLKRWQLARQNADEMLTAMVGQDISEKLQAQADNQAPPSH